MLLELGPLPPDDVRSWVRFARRVICELRLDPGDLAGVVTSDSLDAWSTLVDAWDVEAAESTDTFRWSDADFDPELSGYLLHAMDRIVHSDDVQSRLTAGEAADNTAFTVLVVKAFADGLCAVGTCQSHLVAQIMSSLTDRLDLDADIRV